jgi:hypothetical protein
MENQDPWKHRSAGMRCRTCMWFAPKQMEVQPDERLEAYIAARNAESVPGTIMGAAGAAKAGDPYKVVAPQEQRRVLGRCRRHAPTMNGFPVVFAADWCGDHRLDENKV